MSSQQAWFKFVRVSGVPHFQTSCYQNKTVFYIKDDTHMIGSWKGEREDPAGGMVGLFFHDAICGIT
jgi:hypothetical protein